MKNLTLKYTAVKKTSPKYFNLKLKLIFLLALSSVLLNFVSSCSNFNKRPDNLTKPQALPDKESANYQKQLAQEIETLKQDLAKLQAKADNKEYTDPVEIKEAEKKVAKTENRIIALRKKLNEKSINNQKDVFDLGLDENNNQPQADLGNFKRTDELNNQKDTAYLNRRKDNLSEDGDSLSDLINSYQDPDLIPPENPKELQKLTGAQIEYTRAYGTFLKGEYTKAVRELSEFLVKFNNDYYAHNAHYWLGMSYFNLKLLDLAEMHFRKVLKHFAHSNENQGYKTADAIYMLGRLFEKQNEETKSIYYYLKVVEKFPKSAIAGNARIKLRQKLSIK